MKKVKAISRRLRASYNNVEMVEPRWLMSTYTVNTTSDAAQTPAGVLTLRHAVDEANLHPGADTITFAPTIFTKNAPQTITLTQGPIDLYDTTTITGPGGKTLAINGGGYSRIFEIASYASVQIANLTLTNGVQLVADGAGNTYGGAIYSAGILKISNCSLTKNRVIGTGETFNPTAQGNTAGIAYGGAVYSTGSLTITNSTLSGNSVTNVAPADDDDFPILAGASFGGAIYGTGPVVLSDDNLSDNTATGNGTDSTSGPVAGGGVYAEGSLTITSSNISGNNITAPATGENGFGGSANGGGVYAGGALSISNSTIDSNQALAGDSGYSEGNSGVGRGGGIYAAGSVTISSTAINQNVTKSGLSDTADDYYENEIPAAGGGLFAFGSASLSSDTIDFNSVTGSAGDPNLPQVPTGAGGGIYAGSLTLHQSSVSDNAVTSTFEYAVSEYRQGGLVIGGGIVTTQIASIFDTTIAGNSATGGDGYDKAIDEEDGQGTPAGDGLGGGVYAYAPMTVINSTIANNSAKGGTGGSDEDSNRPGFDGGAAAGGGIYSTAAVNVYDSTITGNKTTGGPGGEGDVGFPSGRQGAASSGGIDAESISPVLDNSIISANLAANSFDDIRGTAASTSGGNLIGIGAGLTNGSNNNKVGINDPQLSPLGYYGGKTQTLLPLPTSPAIDAGSNSLIPPGVITDQRGDPRLSGKAVDIGSVEFGSVTLTGSVFNDQYASGKLQTGDTGVQGFTVYLDLNRDGTLDAGDIATVTNSSGKYTFTGLFPGTYTVKVVSQQEYRPTTSQTTTITAKTNTTTTVSAFGQTQDALATGSVLLDKSPLANVRVFLDLTGSGKFAPGDPCTLTTSAGLFSLNIASPGIYGLRILPASNHKVATPTAGFYTLPVGKASIRSGLTFIET